ALPSSTACTSSPTAPPARPISRTCCAACWISPRPGFWHRANSPGSSLEMTDALVLEGLTKVFAKPAVDHLSLRVRAGELYALLGPNGAGKTTTLRMVAGLLKPTSGSIRVFGV